MFFDEKVNILDVFEVDGIKQKDDSEHDKGIHYL